MENLYNINEIKISYKLPSNACDRPKLLSSQDIYRLLLNLYDDETIQYKEFCKIILLNHSNLVLGVLNLSEGGIDKTVIDIRLVIQSALMSNSTRIVISHNHPSGNLTPSFQDNNMTDKLKQACNLMQIELLDHIIVTSDGYFSYADECRL